MSTKRSLTRVGGLLATAAVVLAACSSTGGGAKPGASAGNMDDLVKAAKAEGNLTTIALPHSWCNYAEMLSGFTAKYGIKINELNPDGSSDGSTFAQPSLDQVIANSVGQQTRFKSLEVAVNR